MADKGIDVLSSSPLLHMEARINELVRNSSKTGTKSPTRKSNAETKTTVLGDGLGANVEGPTQREARELWYRLGAEAAGELTVVQIIRYARHLEKTFPSLLEKHQEIAVKGKVSWEAFLALYDPAPIEIPKLGEPVGAPPSPTDTHLRRVFSHLDADDSGEIRLSEVIRARNIVYRELPELIDRWAEIDLDESGTINWGEFRAFFGGVDAWLEFQLGELVGLEPLKEQVRMFWRDIRLDQLREERGLRVMRDKSLHMIFQGNPGTGKTAIGRLIAKLLCKAGILETDEITEVQPEELVAGDVGQTAMKTAQVVQGAASGLLFVDEAYRLSQNEGRDAIFGLEAIDQLMQAMILPPTVGPVMVFSGSKPEMEEFLSVNDSVCRRMPHIFTFPDYSCAELAEILQLLCERRGFKIEELLLKNGRQVLASIIESRTLPSTRSLMNGSLCEKIFPLAKDALDARTDPLNPSDVLCGIDIVAACELIPALPLRVEHDLNLELTESDVLRQQMMSMQSELGELRLDKACLENASLQPGSLKLHSQKPVEGWTPYISRDEEAAIRQEYDDLRAERARMMATAKGLEERLNATEADNLLILKEGAPEGARIGIFGELAWLRRDNAKLRQETGRIHAESREREYRLKLAEAENAGLKLRVESSILKADADLEGLGPREEYDTRHVMDKQMQVLAQRSRTMSPERRG